MRNISAAVTTIKVAGVREVVTS